MLGGTIACRPLRIARSCDIEVSDNGLRIAPAHLLIGLLQARVDAQAEELFARLERDVDVLAVLLELDLLAIAQVGREFLLDDAVKAVLGQFLSAHAS